MIQKYNTKLKPRIIAAFSATPDGMLSAADVFSILRDGGVDVNLTTVYRNLDRMTEEGVLLRFSDTGGGAKYKYSGERGECLFHIHAKCTECGELLHLDCGFMEKLCEHTKEEHGFSISAQSTMLFGICKKCSKKREADA